MMAKNVSRANRSGQQVNGQKPDLTEQRVDAVELGWDVRSHLIKIFNYDLS